MKNYTQGKKHIVEVDGWMYAIYASSPYHLWEYNANGWTRLKAPQLWHRETFIGHIFKLLKAKITKNA